MKTQNRPVSEITESTQAQTNSEIKTVESSSSNFWHTVLVGGVPGILVGASAAVATDAIAINIKDKSDADIDKGTSGNHSEIQHILVAHSVTDDMSFNEAFAAARAEVGPGGAFTWHGNVYSTYRADDPEWQEMSDEQRAEHGQLIMSQVHATPYSPAVTAPQVDEANSDTPSVADHHDGQDEGTHDVDVHIVGVTQAQMADGSVVDLGYGQVDGHSAMFVDNDGDGEVDTVLIDANDNHLVDGNDAFVDVHGSAITIGALAAEAQANGYVAPDDNLYDDMPDYSNDADTGSYV